MSQGCARRRNHRYTGNVRRLQRLAASPLRGQGWRRLAIVIESLPQALDCGRT